jgi:hypothetical protein
VNFSKIEPGGLRKQGGRQIAGCLARMRPSAGFGENESFLPVGLQPEGPPDAQMIQKSHGFLSLSQLELTL